MKMRKFLAILCVIAMLCSIAPVVSAEETSTEIWSGSATGGSNWWDWVLDVSVDGTVLTEGGYISIYSDIVGNFNLILSGEMNGWAQIKPEYEGYTCEEADGGYVTMIPYATMLDIYDEYGATNLSDVTKFTIYSSCGTPATISKITYTVGEVPVPEPEVTVVYTGDTAYSGWQDLSGDIYTTNWGGTLPAGFITEGGYLSAYVTGTDLWQIRISLNGAKWTEIDWHIEPEKCTAGTLIDLGDNNYIVTFTYNEIVELYGTDDFAGTLGAVYVSSNSGAEVTVTSVTYTPVELHTEHSFNAVVTDIKASDANCTEGEKHYVRCDYCDVISDTVAVEVGDPLGHDMSDADCENAPVCQREGCDHTEGEALGHDYVGTVTKEPTCTEKGEKTYTCENDPTHTYTEPVDIDAEAHSWDEGVVTKNPTCSAKGELTYTCKHNKEHTKTEDVDVDTLAHTDADDNGVCDNCEAEVCKHECDTAVTAPTCEKKGYTTYTCKHCSYTYVGDNKDALGHEYESEVTTKATCDKEGVETFTCKHEGCDDSYTKPIATVEHKWVEADCENAKTCSVCEKTEGEALGHDWVDADCENAKTCAVCEKTDGEAAGHNWVDADCENAKTCSVCEKTEGEALGHNWVDADCENAKTCSVCKKTEGEALGHNWSDATCTDPAACSVCASTKGEALGHKWDDGVVTKEATTEAAGEKTYTCSVCKSTKTESISKLPAPGGSTTVIYSGDAAVTSGWQMAVQVYATAWGGSLDGSIFTEGGHVSVNMTCATADIWSAHVVLQGTGSGNGWQQIDKDVATFTVNDDGSYTVTVTYDELVNAYGGSDFTDLGCFYVYVNTGDGNSVTVTTVEYVVPGTEEDKAPEQEKEPEQDSKENNTVDTPIFTGEAAATGNWTMITEVMTTLFEGALDPSIINEEGYISVYYTGTSGQIYLALQDGTNWGWYQIDTPSSTAAVEGGYVSTFSYADLAKAYGKEDFSDLGKLIIGSTNASDIVISQIAWTQTSTNADTGDASMLMLAAILMVMMAACMVTTVSMKKRR